MTRKGPLRTTREGGAGGSSSASGRIRDGRGTLRDLGLSAGVIPSSSDEWLHDVLTASGDLTPRGEQVARFIAAHPRVASFATAGDIARRVGVNAATVVRFAQRVGFSGWADFQLNFRHRYYLGTLLPTELMRERAAHDGAETWYEAALQQDIANLTAALKSPQSDSITAAASTIAKSRRTLVAASGSYVAPAQVLSHLGSFMGYEIEMESRGGAHLVASLSRLTADDCIVVVSFWRLLRQEVLAAQYCRRSGIPTVVIADSAFSPLTKAGDIAITVPTDGVAFFQSVTTATSVVYAILAELHEMGGEHVSLIVSRAQEMFDELDVLYS